MEVVESAAPAMLENARVMVPARNPVVLIIVIRSTLQKARVSALRARVLSIHPSARRPYHRGTRPDGSICMGASSASHRARTVEIDCQETVKEVSRTRLDAR